MNANIGKGMLLLHNSVYVDSSLREGHMDHLHAW